MCARARVFQRAELVPVRPGEATPAQTAAAQAVLEACMRAFRFHCETPTLIADLVRARAQLWAITDLDMRSCRLDHEHMVALQGVFECMPQRAHSANRQ